MSEMLTEEQRDGIYLASGLAHPALSQSIAESLGIELGPVKHKLHPNGEVYARYEDSVRGKHVFVIQSHVGGLWTPEAGGSSRMTSPNDAIAQQELLADAAKTSSASRITAVAPFMGYLRQDRKAKGREGVGARRLIRNLVNNGFDSFVTVDMHSASVQVAFDGPFDNLIAQMLLREAMIEEIAGYNRADCLVVAPDAGATKMADRHRKELGTKLLYLAKSRDAGDSLKISREERVEEADGRVCVVFDDMIDTAGTLVSAANALKNSGAIAVYVAATHGLFSEPAIENLQGAPIDRILVTDTVPVDDVSEALGEKLRVVSVGPMIANALKQIITNGSVSELFNDQNHL